MGIGEHQLSLHDGLPGAHQCRRYVGLIAEGRFEEAYRIARDPNPLPASADESARTRAKLPAAAARSTGPFPSGR